jgi:UDP-N-acetylmuramoylalanine--D-glutamate ligase
VGMVTGAWEPSLLDGVDLVVASPGFSERSFPVVETLEYGTPLWSEIEFAWRCMDDVPVVAVTGTNGKTTVTSSTARMLAASGLRTVAAGNIGTALSDVVGMDLDVAVVEVSSFQLRFIERFHPQAACLLNLAADHLDWHGSVEAYAAAKSRIHERQGPDDVLVYDADDPGAEAAVRTAASDLHPVSGRRLPDGGSGRDGDVVRVGALEVPVADLRAPDPAFVVDLVAAAVLALDRGAEPEAVATVMREFEPGPHRRTLVARIDRVDYVDDSKATNPHAALAAIAAYPSVVLIAGGLAKGLDPTVLASAAGVRVVVAMGESGPTLRTAAGRRGRVAASMEEAVATARDVAVEGDTVLLAPGAASFDQYESYADRGDAFAAAVRRMERERG